MRLTRKHKMPFGSEILADGNVLFRIWAPKAKCVDLCIKVDQQETLYAMQAVGDGWFEFISASAGAGTLYRYRIDNHHAVADPAARFQPGDVHGYSQVVDPTQWLWQDCKWLGRPWEEAVIYELHVGSFTPEGTFRAAAAKLSYLQELGVTAIELMPIADFPGRFNWGYDGVLPYAPDSRYGTPEDLKALIEIAHSKDIMVFLDVVYNHFGPEGNYLHFYAPAFFSKKHHTPWGKAFNFDGKNSHWVRAFFIHNALYWLNEFHFDGLRLDAVQCIIDDGSEHFLYELATTIRANVDQERQIHLVLENDDNAAGYLCRDIAEQPIAYTAQWNDDTHHALHLLLTGERWGYYGDFADDPMAHLIRGLKDGFSYQGEPSTFRQNRARGESSNHLPPMAFVNFLQNHDHIGNRAFSERICRLIPPEAVQAATALILLAPFPPMLFMGQEWGSSQPFRFFCDFEPHLARRVTLARRREFADVPGLKTAQARRKIPDPNQDESFLDSILDWPEDPDAQRWRDFHRHLLILRQQEIVPRLKGSRLIDTEASQIGDHGLKIQWSLGDGSRLGVLANLGNSPLDLNMITDGRLLYALNTETSTRQLPPWSIVWTLRDADKA